MNETRKQRIHDLLKKGIEHGDASAVTVVDEKQYKQHNPMTKEGDIGLAELLPVWQKPTPMLRSSVFFLTATMCLPTPSMTSAA